MAVISYKCPNCDGELVFHPATQKYKCEYCASAFSQQELAQMKPAAEEEERMPELREMGEEWVWIELLAPLYGMDSSYYIKMPPFSDVDKLCCGYPGIVIRGLPYSGYGDLWLAYRRRPEIDP